MYLPEKSIKLRQKMPTVLTSPLSQAQDRKRRAELLEAACQIHGGRHGTNCRTPGEVGLCETTVKKCSNDILVKVFCKGQKIKKKVLPKVYKENLTKYEASDENILRSIAVYYSGGVMGKRKYRATYRDSSYKRSSSKAVRIAVSSCPVPRLVPYNKLMPFIKSIDIGQLHSVRETLCHGLDEEEKVDGIYRDIQPLLLSLAEFYLSQSRYQLVWFGDEVNTFHVSLGGDGPPSGKDDTAFACLVNFLNLGRGVLSSNENFLLFGGNCKEDCVPVLRFLKKVVHDISDLEKTTFTVNCNGTPVDVKFRISELPNDMKMLSFLAGELSNSATYFSTFADVSSDTMTRLDGTFGTDGKVLWKPWKYENRMKVVKQVDVFKKSLEKKKMAASTRRAKVTSFIAQKHSRQEFEPVVGKLIDRAHVDPLHLKNNACARAHQQLLSEVIAMSKLTDEINSFSQVPAHSPFKRYIAAMSACGLSRLAKKVTKWFDDTKANGKSFDYCFTGKDSRLFLLHFMSLIAAVESRASAGRETTILHLLHTFVFVLGTVSLFSRLAISDEEVSELKTLCTNYFRANAVFFYVNPTVWTIGHLVPAHTQHKKEKYGFGLGLYSMEGREAKRLYFQI